MKDDRLYVIHVRECIARVQRYTADGRVAFLEETKTQDAVLRVLQTLAESTQRLSDSVKVRHPEIHWRAISGFRNVLVHGYLGIDLEQVWDVVDRDLPGLAVAVDAIEHELVDDGE